MNTRKFSNTLQIAAVLVLIVVSCGAPSGRVAAAQSATTYEGCATGTSYFTVPADYSSFSRAVSAYVVKPNVGCNLPTLYCIYMAGGYGGGFSCTVIKP